MGDYPWIHLSPEKRTPEPSPTEQTKNRGSGCREDDVLHIKRPYHGDDCQCEKNCKIGLERVMYYITSAPTIEKIVSVRRRSVEVAVEGTAPPLPSPSLQQSGHMVQMSVALRADAEYD